MTIIRAILGSIILLIDWITTPRGIKRATDKQTAINAETAKLALYEYKACPFCVKVRREMKRQSLPIERRDAKRSDEHKEALLQGGGKLRVPCLRIEHDNSDVEWLYESSEIIGYLQGRFAETPSDDCPAA